jgi:hypothetical protein
MTEVYKMAIVDYTNYRGDRSERRVIPKRIEFTTSAYHGNVAQWFLIVHDVGKNAERQLAMSGIHSWRAP